MTELFPDDIDDRRRSIGARRNPETEEAILEAAEAIMAEEGIAGFSIEAVAKRARAGKPTIYKWWPGKTALLLDLLERERFERVLVFTRTRRGAERLSHILSAREHSVNRIHADRTQSQRESALRGFRDGRTRVLVATDIAARGLDVDLVSHVINYDVPSAPEDYVHRIGRTGRAGNQGRAITIVTPVDELSMRAIERLTGQSVKRVVLPAFGGTSQPLSNHGRTSTGNRRSSGVSTGVFTRSFRPRRASR